VPITLRALLLMTGNAQPHLFVGWFRGGDEQSAFTKRFSALQGVTALAAANAAGNQCDLAQAMMLPKQKILCAKAQRMTYFIHA
jgi:hypothetical protein